MKLLALLILWAQSPFQVAPDHYKLVFENPYARVVRVIYGPHEKSPLHDHPANPTVYVYVTDGGKLLIVHHDENGPVRRPPAVAGGVRFNRGMAEQHTMEELDGIASEYIRVELKTKPVDLPTRDVRLTPDAAPFENGQVRISHLSCESGCPASKYPSVDVPIGSGPARWVEPGGKTVAAKIVRVELKTPPL